MNSTHDFWIDIEKEFSSWNDYFSNLKLLSQPIRDLFQASRKFKDIDFDIEYWISNSLFLAPKALSPENRMYYVEACIELELCTSSEYFGHRA